MLFDFLKLSKNKFFASNKLKEFKIEMTKIMEEQKSMELEFELNDSKFTTAIRDLDKKYPMGELDLNEGIVIYESTE
jgi:hypothetical protein